MNPETIVITDFKGVKRPYLVVAHTYNQGTLTSVQVASELPADKSPSSPTWEEFRTKLYRLISAVPPHMRLGQAIYNFVHEQDPAMGERLRRSGNDPFHDNTRVPEALVWLEEEFSK